MNLAQFFQVFGTETTELNPSEPFVLAPQCYTHGQAEPCPDCAEEQARGYAVRILAGRCANGSELGGGTRWHAVPMGSEGLAWTAQCGEKPGRRSAGWSSWVVRGQAVTCPRCLKKLEAGRDQ